MGRHGLGEPAQNCASSRFCRNSATYRLSFHSYYQMIYRRTHILIRPIFDAAYGLMPTWELSSTCPMPTHGRAR